MNWLQSMIYGFVSGLSELIPVSSSANQYLLVKLFGVDRADPVLNLLVHIAVLLSVYMTCKNLLGQIGWTRQHRSHSRGRAQAKNYDNRFIKTAAIAFGVISIILTYVFKKNFTLAGVALFSLINGLVLFVSSRALQGNKDSRLMSGVDSVATGALSALSVLPGISRTGIALCVPMVRGADRQKTLNWILIFTIPALVLLSVMDIIEMFTAFQAMRFGVYVGYLLAAGCAYLGGVCGIRLMRFLAVRTGYSGFAFYSWGVALFAFILYLI